MKIRVLLNLSKKNSKLKSIYSQNSKKQFNSYRMKVIIEGLLLLVVDLWGKNCAKQSVWTLTLFSYTFLHQIWQIIDTGQLNITKFKVYSQILLNCCMRSKPKILLFLKLHWWFIDLPNHLLFLKHYNIVNNRLYISRWRNK